MTEVRTLDRIDLETRVKQMYQQVALEPKAEFHFETGRGLAEHLGYPATDLDAVPAPAIDSFAGVGYFLDLAALTPGERALDLGSGSGMDSFLAANSCGPAGSVIGVDMTRAQLDKRPGWQKRPASPRSSSAKATSRTCRSRTAPSTA
jgi:methylase of polypeptide subunit release factors